MTDREKRASVIRRRRIVALLALTAVAGGIAAGLLALGGGTSPGVEEEDVRQAGRLSLSEQARQVLLVGVEGDGRSPEGPADRLHGAGAVLLGAANYSGRDQLRALARSAAREADEGIPALITAQQEGGEYRAFSGLPPADRQLNIGDEADRGLARAWARDTGEALGASGFHLALFPVADAATLDSPIADRAFSEDVELVARLTAAALEGCDDAEIVCAPLHFPGLGGASHDTTLGPATVGFTAADLAELALAPFVEAIETGARAIVISTAFYAAYDPVTPAALAPEVVTGLLRDELGFEGVAITDDLSTGAGAAAGGPAGNAVAALAAGADLVQLSDPRHAGPAAAAIERAVRSGELDAARLTEAAARVIRLKRREGLVERVGGRLDEDD